MDYNRFRRNRTPFTVSCLPLDAKSGRRILLVVAKMTYAVEGGKVRIASEQAPVRTGDVRYGDVWSSIRYPSDYCEHKPGTDVIMIATAHPPAGQKVKQHDVSLRVGPLQKAVRVFGPRKYVRSVTAAIVPGPPEVLGPTPIVYELAFGGRERVDGELQMYAKNGSGRGFAKLRNLVDEPAHQIEPLATAGKTKSSEPAGFGAIDRTWDPRVGYAGTCDARWARERAPILPEDFDHRHNCAAHPELRSATPLHGDEPVEVLGATPEGIWRFRLPRYAPRFSSILRDPIELDGLATEHPTHLDTFLIDAEERRVELTWRATVVLPHKYETLEAVHIHTDDRLPEDMLADLRKRTVRRMDDEVA